MVSLLLLVCMDSAWGSVSAMPEYEGDDELLKEALADFRAENAHKQQEHSGSGGQAFADHGSQGQHHTQEVAEEPREIPGFSSDDIQKMMADALATLRR